MNKKELTKKTMERMQKFGYFPNFTNVKTFIKEYEKSANPEPTKPVVPQFVADWYEENKDDLEYSIWNYMYSWDSQEDSEFKNWFDHAKNNPLQTIINMHQFGYEVEKEKRYKVTLSNGQPLVKPFNRPNIYFSQNILDLNYKATKKELEEVGFGWVFDCPGIEVEEVEE